MNGQQSQNIESQEDSPSQIDSFPNYPNHPRVLSAPPHLLQTRPFPPIQQNTQTTPVETPETAPVKKPKITPTTSSEDNSTIDSARKSTGRPRGSKNKPKAPIVVTQPSQPGLTPYIIELPPGSDLVSRVTRLTHQRGVSLCIVSATGAVCDVTLKQPSMSAPGGTVFFRGKFDILSLSACLLVNKTSFDAGFNGVFSITMSAPHGRIVGGKVGGPLVCAGVVYVVATSFSNPDYTRLPIEVASANQSDGDGDGDGETEIGGGYLKKNGNSGNVVWTPAPLTARPPQPPLN